MKLEIPELKFLENKISKNSYEIKDLDLSSVKSLAFVLRWQLARNRAGTANTKKMSEISGTTAKPWKQKGTGRARQGSRRSVQFVGGRTCHGPNTRSFDFQMPKKIAKIGINHAIKNKLIENNVYTFDSSQDLKTKIVAKFLTQNNFDDALFIISDLNSNCFKSIRNIKSVKIIKDTALNALDIINYKKVIIDNNSFSSKIMEAIK